MTWTHLRDSTYKARKLHRCFLCNGWIAIGDTYIYRVGKDDEGISVTKMHPECEYEMTTIPFLLGGPALPK